MVLGGAHRRTGPTTAGTVAAWRLSQQRNSPIGPDGGDEPESDDPRPVVGESPFGPQRREDHPFMPFDQREPESGTSVPGRLRAWAHTLGFWSHWLTRSRSPSFTLSALRAARHDWSCLQRHSDQAPVDTVALGSCRFAGRGWTTDGDAMLAETAAASRADARGHVVKRRPDERRSREEVDRREHR